MAPLAVALAKKIAKKPLLLCAAGRIVNCHLGLTL